MAPDPSFPTLVTERLVLRELQVSDAVHLFPIFSDAETMRHWSTPPHRTPEETALAVESMQASRQQGTGIEWAITLHGDDRAIGKLCHHHWMKEHRRSQVGYILRRDLWRRGLTREALRAIVDYGFLRMGLHSIEAQLDPRNVGSVRALERVGFVLEGHLRESFILDGELCDTLIYSLREPRTPATSGSR